MESVGGAAAGEEAQAPGGEAQAPGGEAQGPGGEALVQVQAEPGASPRLRLLTAAMETTVEKLLEAASFEKFAHCYKPVHQVQPQLTLGVHKQLVVQLQTSIREEIQQISEDGLFERALPKLDKLETESADRTTPAWRPTGSPGRDLRAHLLRCSLQQCEYLRLKLRRAKEENAAVAGDVLHGRQRVSALQKQMEERIGTWQECNRICQRYKLSLQ